MACSWVTVGHRAGASPISEARYDPCPAPRHHDCAAAIERTLTRLVVLAVALFVVSALPAAASDNRTVVSRGSIHSEFFGEDICGARATNVTWTETVSQWQYFERADGSWSYRDVATVTFEIDFVDPALADYSGRLTEVNHVILTPGDTFVVTNTYHDFGGDLKIWERLNVKIVDGQALVERGIFKVTGCP